MLKASTKAQRVSVDGKFFRLGEEKFCAKGVTYGPFAPDANGECFGTHDQVRQDFRQILDLGANTLRVYFVPPRWFLDLALEYGLRVLVDVPWNRLQCFLDAPETKAVARQAVRTAAQACNGHLAVLAISVVNEIPPDIVRWSGAKRVAEFIDELVAIVKNVDAECLCTFGNFPPTEFLRPQSIDFHCFNVYLHRPKPFENYLARLQMIADGKPLMLGEFGVDTLREGEERQAEILAWKIELAYRAGAAGAVIYSFTDDWFKDGEQIEDWAFGLTRRDRSPKPSFAVARRLFKDAPHFALDRYPQVSVIVACYNGARTLAGCLDSLVRLNYPACEIILVDDGSTDATPEIAARYPTVRNLRHARNEGLSVARNTGVAAAQGEIIAFSDADCRVNEDWLYYLVSDLMRGSFVGIGGPNLLPPDDSWVAAAVMVSPGGPAHVMLTDRIAEHIPGCNMAFYKWALEEIGGFDPIFRKAGDDVDVCWRLQQRGHKLGFSAAGFVWHYRRSTVRDYLKQQHGYGEAEALLVRRHPENFNWFGGSQWQGRIYSPAKFGLMTRAPIIYHGVFSSGFFQTLYASQPAYALMFLTSLEYHVLFTLPLLVLGSIFRELIPLVATSVLISLSICVAAAVQAELPKTRRKLGSRPLVALLFFLQPLVRGWARYRGNSLNAQTTLSKFETLDSLGLQRRRLSFDSLAFWNERALDRLTFLASVIGELGKKNWPNKSDPGWGEYDIEIFGSRWCRLQLLTATEILRRNKQILQCQLKTRWSPFAKTLFWGGAAVELLVVGILSSVAPLWIWLLPLTLVVLGWWLRRTQRDMRRVVAVFLSGVANELGLIPIEADVTVKPSAAATLETVGRAETSQHIDPPLSSEPAKDSRA